MSKGRNPDDTYEQLLNDAAKIVRSASEHEERCDDFLIKVTAVLQGLPGIQRGRATVRGGGGGRPVRSIPRGARVGMSALEWKLYVEEMKDSAARGADLHVLKQRLDGSVRIQIDGKKPFDLEAAQWKLLATLLDLNAASPDGRAAHVSLEALAKLLSPETGLPPLRHTINGWINRVRRRFLEQGVNKYYIDTVRGRGVRFLVRTVSHPLPPHDRPGA